MNSNDLSPTAMTFSAVPTAHLSEDELDEVLLGFAARDVASHADACDTCRARVEAFKTGIAVFNGAATGWSEARSQGLGSDLSVHRPAFRLSALGLYSACGAALVAVAIALSTGLRHEAAGTAEAMRGTQTKAATEAVARDEMEHQAHSAMELASDNAMLAAIDSEMNTPQAARFGLYQNTQTRVSGMHRNETRQVRD